MSIGKTFMSKCIKTGILGLSLVGLLKLYELVRYPNYHTSHNGYVYYDKDGDYKSVMKYYFHTLTDRGSWSEEFCHSYSDLMNPFRMIGHDERRDRKYIREEEVEKALYLGKAEYPLLSIWKKFPKDATSIGMCMTYRDGGCNGPLDGKVDAIVKSTNVSFLWDEPDQHSMIVYNRKKGTKVMLVYDDKSEAPTIADIEKDGENLLGEFNKADNYFTRTKANLTPFLLEFPDATRGQRRL